MAIIKNKEIKSRENLNIQIKRINESRNALEKALNELNKRINNPLESIDEIKGFDIERIENSVRNEEREMLIKRRDAIKKALKQDNYCDLEFCKAAKEYIESIKDTINQYDEEIRINAENVQKAKKYLEEMKEKQERENYELRIMIDDLLEPLDGSVFSEFTFRSGKGVLNRIEKRINEVIN